MFKKTRIYADVVGDLFHRGHVEFFRKLSKLKKNSRVIIGIHSDETIMTYKRKPIFCMEDRIEIIKSCKFVDEIIPNAPLLITENFLKKHNIHFVVHGDDMTDFLKKCNYPIPIKLNIMITVPRWDDISTSQIIQDIKNL